MLEPKIHEKRWEKQIEEQLCQQWKEQQAYQFDAKSKKKVYSIDTPPPYVNTPIHIGQATTYVLMDMFARYRRMMGYQVLFPLGLDRNGLPIEMAAEKKFNVKLNQVKREEFLKMCEQVLQESSVASEKTFLRLGISFNSWKQGKDIGDMYCTDSKEYRALTQSTFIDLWEKDLIYEDERVNNYCPGCRTTLADSEVVYEEKDTFFHFITFKIKDSKETLMIGTTRPELLCSCAAILFHPKDTRYQHLEGKKAVVPVYGKEVVIMEHPSADMKMGTGLVMMCSFGDTDDIRFFREEEIEPIIAIGQDGKMNERAGFLAGKKVKEARELIVEKLTAEGLFVKKEMLRHRTPVCERSGDPIEFISMKEFYLKQVEFVQTLREMTKNLHFYAEKSRQLLLDWIDSIRIDWPISRRRYYGTEIPLWYCKDCHYAVLPEKGNYVQPWKEKAPVKKCKMCEGTSFIGEERVFDTWFDSSSSPLWILQYGRDDAFFKKYSPCSLRPQGKEIVRTWLYYTLLKSMHLTKQCIFSDVWINYHITDERGHKMSKSKGNIIKPEVILDKYGTEPFRLWCAVEGNLAETDLRVSFERIEGAGKTVTKLWNIARFISMFAEKKQPKELCALDMWIIHGLHQLVKEAEEQYEHYNFHTPVTKLKHFLWETFASHYLELVKSRAYNEEGKFSTEEQDSALFTLHYCLDIVLKLLAPVLPLMTYQLYFELRQKDIHRETFPVITLKVQKGTFTSEELAALNSELWKCKKEKGLSLKDGLKEVTIEKKFQVIEKDLQAIHHIGKVSYGEFKVVA